MIFTLEFTKGHNSCHSYFVNNVGGNIILVFCTSSDHFYICTKFHEIISKGLRVIEQTQFVMDRQTD